VIENILQEAEEYITYIKLHREGSDKEVNSAVNAWWKVFDEFEKYRKSTPGCPGRQINRLVDKGKPLPWEVYMGYHKRYRNHVLLETWDFHFGHISMAELMWSIRQEMEQYISHVGAVYPNGEELVAKTWRAWRWISGNFRKRAGTHRPRMFKEYQRKRLGKR
jgi:hypothetical protein